MFVPLPLIALAVLALVVLALLARRRGGGDMIEQQRRMAPPPPARRMTGESAEKILAQPDIAAAIAAGHKIEAIKLVRERTGLGLKEAKDLVERGQ